MKKDEAAMTGEHAVTRFHEEQRFRQWWLWAIVIANSVIGAAVMCFVMIEVGRRGGGAIWAVGPLFLLLMAGVLALFAASKLTTQVTDEALYVRFRPFHLHARRFLPGEIASCEAITYRPMLEYGGWGLRWGLRGKAYNVSGNRGVRLQFINGKRLLIGSRRAEELAEAIRAIRA